jgi:EutQ-like cupin domain
MSSGTVRAAMGGARPNLPILSLPILTPEGGKPIELKAGDVCVIEPGFKAIWEVVEQVRKDCVFVLA